MESISASYSKNEDFNNKSKSISSTSSMKEFFGNVDNSSSIISSPTYYSHLWKSEYIPKLNNNEKYVMVEIEIIYKEDDANNNSKLPNKNGFIANTTISYYDLSEKTSSEESKESRALETYRHSARVYVPCSKIGGTFIENELNKNGDKDKNYIKIELRAKRNKIQLETVLDCLEFLINKNYEFHYNKDNLISYFYAFSLCQISDKRKEVLEKLLQDLTDDNIVYFLKVVSTIDDEFLQSYSFWLLRYLINKSEKLGQISFNGYNYANIVKISNGSAFTFDDNRIIFNNLKKSILNVSANLNFLKNYYDNQYRPDLDKYFNVNNHFNMGRVLRRKSDNSLVDDYPHYYQLILENDPSLLLYAMRPSENGNFIISKSIDDFTKYGMNYIAEVNPNFWGTYFDLFDFGFEKAIYDASPKGSIQYETNIMGECPRYFKLDIIHNKQVHKLENLKPEWNEDMDCYCLNFYGRVKKASAKNFQIVYPDDPDNILLQHGKVTRDEFNIDFREPFNYIFAFAVSLVAIGKKRVVS